MMVCKREFMSDFLYVNGDVATYRELKQIFLDLFVRRHELLKGKLAAIKVVVFNLFAYVSIMYNACCDCVISVV